MRVPRMKLLLPLSLAVAIAAALPACNADRAAPASEASPDATAPAAAAPSPATDVSRPATSPAGDSPATPPSAAPAPGSGLARYDGYGDMRFGMSEDEARKAWGGALDGEPGEGCHYLNPAWEKAPSYFAFMFDGGKFVRYDVGNDKEVAPGGGRVGMGEAEIDAAYPGRVAKSPHKYVDGGKYLRVKAADGGDGALVFETDAAGKVKEWHAGLAPQVDWIEGCS
jgi:hypothetical protein